MSGFVGAPTGLLGFMDFSASGNDGLEKIRADFEAKTALGLTGESII